MQGSKLSFQDFVISWASTATHARIAPTAAERESVMDRQPTGPNPLNDRDDFSRPALRHGSFNSLFQLPSALPKFTVVDLLTQMGPSMPSEPVLTSMSTDRSPLSFLNTTEVPYALSRSPLSTFASVSRSRRSEQNAKSGRQTPNRCLKWPRNAKAETRCPARPTSKVGRLTPK